MNKFVGFGLGIAAVIVALVVGARFLAPPGSSGTGGVPSTAPTAAPAPTPTAAPTATPAPTPIPVGGTVQFKLDGAATTTVVDAVADGTSLSGTAVTTISAGPRAGTHTVRLECAARDGARLAFVGTIEQTTVPGEIAGVWSAVVVEDGTPQQIGIVFGIEKNAEDCAVKWAGMDMAAMDISSPVESGTLVPPPDLAGSTPGAS